MHNSLEKKRPSVAPKPKSSSYEGYLAIPHDKKQPRKREQTGRVANRRDPQPTSVKTPLHLQIAKKLQAKNPTQSPKSTSPPKDPKPLVEILPKSTPKRPKPTQIYRRYRPVREVLAKIINRW